MSSNWLVGLELAGVLGFALVWGGYELWKLRKYRDQDRAAREAREGREREQAGRD